MQRLFVHSPPHPRQHGSGRIAATETTFAAKDAWSTYGPRQQGSSHITTTEKPLVAVVLNLQEHD